MKKFCIALIALLILTTCAEAAVIRQRTVIRGRGVGVNAAIFHGARFAHDAFVVNSFSVRTRFVGAGYGYGFSNFGYGSSFGLGYGYNAGFSYAAAVPYCAPPPVALSYGYGGCTGGMVGFNGESSARMDRIERALEAITVNQLRALPPPK